MAGIISYGGYIPRLRLNRGAMYAANAWIAPALITAASGERAMANWDEDSVTMAVEASRECIRGFDKQNIDAVYLGSLSFPFQDRQNSVILATALNLKTGVDSSDFGCSMRAGTSALLAGINAVKAGACKTALVAASDKRETKSAWFHELWFGDGAASVLIGNDNVIAEIIGTHTVSYDFVDHFKGINQKYDYFWEERWVRDEGFAKIVPESIAECLKKTKVEAGDIAHFIMPSVFGREAKGVAKKLGIGGTVHDNLHAVCGETGTAHALVMLVKALQEAQPGEKILVAAFGQGCSTIILEVTENIKKLPERRGINGFLADRKEEKNYMKYLSFNNLVIQEKGMRAEADWKTALSFLYRHRKLLTGFVGGKCTKCGTAQIPSMEICVNPECGAMHTQEELEFSEEKGKIITWSSDMLTYSPDPPAHYGMIEFGNGGRMMMDFTDHDIGNVEVGMPVELVFRIRNIDPARGFTRYFWKAKPIYESKEA